MQDFDHDPEPGDVQRRLVSIADAVVFQLGVSVNYMAQYSPEGMRHFVEACNGAMWFSFNARMFDRRLEAEREKGYWESG